MTKSKGILPPRRFWSDYEDQVLRLHYPTTRAADLAELFNSTADAVCRRARKLGLAKDAAWVVETARQRTKNPHHGGRHTRFQPGIVPANKGKKMPNGWAPGDMARTQFKPGQKPSTWKPIGSLRINGEGYLDRKVNDLPGGNHVRWHPVHRLVWEAANGPVPAGHVVVFKPGMHTTNEAAITLDRVELITRAQLMARNTIHNLPGPLADVIRLRGTLKRAINRREKEANPT